MWRALHPIAHHEVVLLNCSRALVNQISLSLDINGSSIAAHDSQLWSTRQSSTCHFSSSSYSSSPNAASVGTSSATQLWHLQDQILLKGLTFHGYHGALLEENVLGQKFVVDATLWADLAAAGNSDKLADTIDYSKAYSVVQRVVQGPARVLQEAVAEEVCQQLLQLDTRVTAVQVYIRKPHVALTGTLDSVGVQIFRSRQ